MVPIVAEEVAGKTVPIVIEAAVIVSAGIRGASGMGAGGRATVDNAEAKN